MRVGAGGDVGAAPGATKAAADVAAETAAETADAAEVAAADRRCGFLAIKKLLGLPEAVCADYGQREKAPLSIVL